MALKKTYWAILSAAACVTLAVALLPPKTLMQRDDGNRLISVAREKSRLSSKARTAVRAWRSAILRDSVREVLSRERSRLVSTPFLIIDPSVTPAKGEVMQRIIARSLLRAGFDSTKMPIAILVLADTLYEGYDAETAPGEGIEYLLPSGDRNTTDPCIAIIRTNSKYRTAEDLPRFVRYGMDSDDRSVTPLGPCAFFAAFGAPGERIAQWLRGRRYEFAMGSQWADESSVRDFSSRSNRFVAGFDGYSDLNETTIEGRACWLGDLAACEATILNPLEDSQSAERLSGSYVGAYFFTASAWPVSSSRLLADMRRELGAEKFTQFWRSDADPRVAFANATGESLGAWTHKWVKQMYGTTVPGAKVPTSFYGWGLLVALGCVSAAAVAASRRTVG